MKTKFNIVQALPWFQPLALCLAVAAGCSDSNSSAGDGGADLSAAGDASSGPDASNGDGGVAMTTLKIVPVSASGPDRFFGVAYDSQGNLYTVGQVADAADSTADISTVVAKFSAAGALDKGFGKDGMAVYNVATGGNGELFRSIVVQSTGKIVVAGAVEHAGASDARDRDIAVLRLNADGTRDATFGTNGVVILDLSTGVANGNSFVADSAWGLARYADDRLILSGGQVRSGGTDTDFALVRLTADGARDATFGSNGVFTLDIKVNGASNNASPRNVTILPGSDGVIGAGYQPNASGDTSPVLYKVNNSGQLDPGFGSGGVFSQAVLAEQAETYEAVVQPTGQGSAYKLVTTGYGRALSTETTDLLSLRLNSDGTLDKSYGTDGLVRIDIGGFGDNSRRVLVLPDRRVLLAGGGRKTAADVDGLVAILTPDGKADTSFGPAGWQAYDLGGPADFLWSAALSPDQRTVALAGVKGVGASPMAGANDDAAVLLLPIAK